MDLIAVDDVIERLEAFAQSERFTTGIDPR